MAISGKVYLYTTPNRRSVYLIAENNGDEPFGITQNYFNDEGQARTQHGNKAAQTTASQAASSQPVPPWPAQQLLGVPAGV